MRKVRSVEGASTEETPKADRRPRKRTRKARVNLAMCEGMVALINLPLTMLVKDMALTEVEVQALVNSLYDLARSNAYVGNFIANLSNASTWGTFPTVVGAIAAKRLAAAGKLPPTVALPAEGIIYGVAARGTRPVDRPNRERKDGTSEGATTQESVLPGTGSEG